ncbi:helix-turn-helix domain-containing protein [Teredinibacter waterburyi]|jgi:AraC-type DNA-binding domain-containing proteins|uniref:helix-turn-helix domain-containing protein n=1 Tax=Teredinibacter waterburyi TaxID=1500538 RepID=UPI00165FDA46|nr:AraC family transcriptional regulator [Teredinibacter waterburyi]
MDNVIFNFHDLVLLTTTFQCVVFSAMLFLPSREKTETTVLLALFLMCHALIPINLLITFGGGFRRSAIESIPSAFYIIESVYWLEGPLLLLYVRSLLYKDFTLKKSHLLLFIPFCFYVLHQLLTYHALSTPDQISLLKSEPRPGVGPWYMQSIYIARDIFLRLGFALIALREIIHYKRETIGKDELKDSNVIWLNVLSYGFAFIYAWDLMVTILTYFWDFNIKFAIRPGLTGLLGNYWKFFLIMGLVFCNLRYSTLVLGIAQRRRATERHSYSGSDIEKLSAFMITEKPFLTQGLSLNKLARLVGIPAKTLSQIVNQSFGKSFAEYVNDYRIEEAKLLMATEQHKRSTLLDIMEIAGFNSKAAFNRAFKTHAGITPSEFRQSISADTQH